MRGKKWFQFPYLEPNLPCVKMDERRKKYYNLLKNLTTFKGSSSGIMITVSFVYVL